MSYYNEKEPNLLPKGVIGIIIALLALLLLSVIIAHGEEPVPKEILAQLKQEEGWRNRSYLDSKRLATIGFGHQVAGRRLTKEEHERLFPGKRYHLAIKDMIRYWDSNPMSKEDGIWLLEQDIELAEKDCKIIFGDLWDLLPDKKKVPLIDMSFQLGLARFLGFKRLIKAVNNGDWKAAGAEARNSKAYREAKHRWEHIAQELEE